MGVTYQRKLCESLSDRKFPRPTPLSDGPKIQVQLRKDRSTGTRSFRWEETRNKGVECFIPIFSVDEYPNNVSSSPGTTSCIGPRTVCKLKPKSSGKYLSYTLTKVKSLTKRTREKVEGGGKQLLISFFLFLQRKKEIKEHSQVSCQ